MTRFHSRRILSALTLGAGSLLACAPLRAEVKAPAFLDLAGPDAYAASAVQRGMQLALAQPEAAGLSGQYLDVKDAADASSGQLKTFVENDKVPTVFHWRVDTITGPAPYLSESNVVGLALWDATRSVPRLGQHIFGFGYSTETSAKEFAKFAGNKLKSYRFGIVSSAEPHLDLQRKAFVEETKSQGNTVVFEEASAGGDFASIVERAKKEKCDTLFAALPAKSAIQFVQAARKGSFSGKILLGDTLFAPELNELGKDAEGVYMMQTWASDEPFAQMYAAKFGGATDGVTLGAAALGYDAVSCVAKLKKGIEGTGQAFGADSLKHQLLAEPCEGLTGKTGFTGERIAQRRKKAVTIKGGEFALAE